jgi:large subunit ribosomal protein L17
MMRNMVTSLLEHERIVTTTPKAKELRKLADQMITLAKRGDLHARRQALSVIRDKGVVDKLFSQLKDEYMDRNGGYTRIIRTGTRAGDAAPMAIIELTNYTEEADAGTADN